MTSESRQFGRTVSVGMDAWAAKYARPCDEYGAAVICTTPISRPPWIVPNESRLSMKALNRVVNVAGGVTSVPALALVSRIAPDTSLLPIHTVTNDVSGANLDTSANAGTDVTPPATFTTRFNAF